MFKPFVANTNDNSAPIVLLVSSSNPSYALAVIPVIASLTVRKLFTSADEVGELGHGLERMFSLEAVEVSDEDAAVENHQD